MDYTYTLEYLHEEDLSKALSSNPDLRVEQVAHLITHDTYNSVFCESLPAKIRQILPQTEYGFVRLFLDLIVEYTSNGKQHFDHKPLKVMDIDALNLDNLVCMKNDMYLEPNYGALDEL